MGHLVTPEQLAAEACEIEIEILGKPIGKQDQYIAAFGGLRKIEFGADGLIQAERIPFSDEQRLRFGESLLLFFTGITRKADVILATQRDNIETKRTTLDTMRDQAHFLYERLSAGDLGSVGTLLDSGWHLKKQLAATISNPEINEYYEKAIASGAIGGKVAGAGGGGFLLLSCPLENQVAVRAALSSLQELPFQLERDGTKVILNTRR
jgi:D-glycero-alpha-D-manno-heptose-7-phosphate kinase